MSFGRKIVSVITLAIAIAGLNTLAIAQDETPKDKDKSSVEKRQRKQGRLGKEGKRGRHGRHARRGMRRGRGARGLVRGLSRVDLTDAQKSQVKTLLQSQRTGNQPLREEMRTLMMKRRDGTITEADKTRLGEIRTEMRNSAEQTKNSILGLLTPEQTQRLEQMKAERRQRMEERRQRRQLRRQERQKEKPAKTTPTKEVG